MADITELSRNAWNAARSDSQPAFDDLETSYRQRLLDRAQNVVTLKTVTEEGGIFQTFEQNIIEVLLPERFHPLSKQFNPKPIQLVGGEGREWGVPSDNPLQGTISVETKGGKTSATVNVTPKKRAVKIVKGTAKKGKK